ncbi:MAG: hypothetical protein JWR63_4398 [Conexibacter sp.]|nr:hypothetical protein [Conexibacter sp.]
MSSRKQPDSLFDLDSVAPRAPRTPTPTPRKLHSVVMSAQARLNRDGAMLLLSDVDGLLLRSVKPHSARKARMVRRDLGTVGRALNRQWFDVQYLELFSGPGRLRDETTGEELPGSPLEALDIPSPFDRYVFSDYDADCVRALRTRIGPHRNVFVERGDANDLEHLSRVADRLDPRALIIAYLDPAKPNLHWATVEYLAARFKHIDFIINLPVSAIHRSLGLGAKMVTEGADPLTCEAIQIPARALGHPDPLQLLRCGRLAPYAIRDYYYEKLRSAGLTELAEPRTVKQELNNSPLYDVILASRHPKAVELWEKANAVPNAARNPDGDLFSHAANLID